VRYYREGFQGCLDVRLLVEDGSQDPAVLAINRELDRAVNNGALEDLWADMMLPRLTEEHVSTIGSLSTFTHDAWSTLLVEANTWELHQATAITGFLRDLGDKGQLSLRE